jgi:hypothetical protein
MPAEQLLPEAREERSCLGLQPTGVTRFEKVLACSAAVLLGHVEVESPVFRVPREAPEMGLATVADADLGQDHVEESVDQSGHEEAGVEGCEGGERGAHAHDREPCFLVEVPLDVELLPAAGGASVHKALLEEGRGGL